MVFKGTKRQANVMINFLNNQHLKIKFKMELKENGIINFLDKKIRIG
jgi:hypothetical protein